MAGTCKICGGLIPASNEVLGYGGPICSGNHGTQPIEININLPTTISKPKSKKSNE